MKLRIVFHDQHTAGLEIDVNHPSRLGCCSYGHAPSGAERKERDRKAFANLVEVVVVWRDAVAAIAIEIETNAVKGHGERVHHAA